MTAQIPDVLLLQDQKLSIAGVNGKGLFEPAQYNLQPFPRITSCWRGYVCTYKVLEDKLLLAALQVNLKHAGPTLDAVEPIFSQAGMFDNTYQDLNLPIDFSGGILAAGGFIHELYMHMGFHPAWKYRTVFELILSHGELHEIRDVSEGIAHIRNEMVKAPPQPGVNAAREQLEEWIAATFKLDYNL